MSNTIVSTVARLRQEVGECSHAINFNANFSYDPAKVTLTYHVMFMVRASHTVYSGVSTDIGIAADMAIAEWRAATATTTTNPDAALAGVTQ